MGWQGRTSLLGLGQAQQALPEVAAVPETLDDDVQEAVVLAGLVLQARGRRVVRTAQQPRRILLLLSLRRGRNCGHPPQARLQSAGGRWIPDAASFERAAAAGDG